MWNRLKCYLSGKHEYGMWCEPGAIFLRCVHCGERSPGWTIGGATDARPDVAMPAARVVTPRARIVPAPVAQTSHRILPFQRAAAR